MGKLISIWCFLWKYKFTCGVLIALLDSGSGPMMHTPRGLKQASGRCYTVLLSVAKLQEGQRMPIRIQHYFL